MHFFPQPWSPIFTFSEKHPVCQGSLFLVASTFLFNVATIKMLLRLLMTHISPRHSSLEIVWISADWAQSLFAQMLSDWLFSSCCMFMDCFASAKYFSLLLSLLEIPPWCGCLHLCVNMPLSLHLIP
jgi:hypothetical protein